MKRKRVISKAFRERMQERHKERRASRRVCTVVVRINGRWEAYATCQTLAHAANASRDAREERGEANVSHVWSTAWTVNDAVEALNR
jgi:hypothetical protein